MDKDEIPHADAQHVIPCSQSSIKATSHIQDEIQPGDSMSNVGSRRSKHSSRSGSRVSSKSSAHIKAEAEMVALVVRQKILKDKHVLEEQEEQLRKKKEQLELEANSAATMAKVQVLEASKGSTV